MLKGILHAVTAGFFRVQSEQITPINFCINMGGFGFLMVILVVYAVFVSYVVFVSSAPFATRNILQRTFILRL